MEGSTWKISIEGIPENKKILLRGPKNQYSLVEAHIAHDVVQAGNGWAWLDPDDLN